MSTKFYDWVVDHFAGVVKWFYKVEIEGIENVPENGALLVCSNHLSMADVVIMAASMPRRITFLAKEEAFHIPVLAQFIKGMCAVPIKRGSGDVGALKAIIGTLKEGNVACVYPQGHRYPGVHPSTTKVHHGVGMMAWRSKADIMPVAFECKGWKIKPFRKTTIKFGKVIKFDELGMEAGNPEQYETATNKIFGKIIELIDKKEKEA